VYFRVHEGRTGGGPVLKVSADAKKVTRFSLDVVSLELLKDRKHQDTDYLRIRNFAPGRNGELFMILEKTPEESYLVQFDADGRYKSTSKIDARMRPTQIAAFGSGDLLIAGTEFLPDPKKLDASSPILNNPKPFTGLFNSRGQLLRRIVLHEDLEPKTEYEETPTGQKVVKIDRDYEKSIAFSTAEAAADGNIYLMRYTTVGPVYVLSPGGVVVKTIRLKPPKDASLTDIKVAGGFMAAKYVRNKHGTEYIDSVILSILNLQTGEEIAQYSHSDANIGSVFACFDLGSYTFLGNDDKYRFQLIRVAPE
jgi:hypothetical protein